jgi:hypothetical protein
MMRYSKLDQMIKEAALELFAEQQNPEKPKEEKSAYEKATEKYDEKKAKEKEAKEKKKTSSNNNKIVVEKPGGGRYLELVRARETRVNNDPEGLMNDLKVRAASGSTDLEKATSILMQAIQKNDIMREAFGMPSVKTVGDSKRVEIPIKSSEISQRNGTKFLYLTLLGAEAANLLSMKDGIKFVARNTVAVPTMAEL